ncbi:MAG: sensor histidine kinase [Armatimonadota bacterium]
MGNARLNVLLVEDSEDDTRLLLKELKRAGYDVSSARVETRGAMQQALAEGAWDIILADYTLPQFSGPKALQVVQEKKLDIPFILVSGTVSEQAAIDIMRAGAHDFILKDNLARLAPAIQRELHESHLRAAGRQAAAALRESEALYRSLVETSPDAIFVADLDLRITFANPQALSMLGAHAACDVVGTAADVFVAQEDRERLITNARIALDTGVMRNVEYTLLTCKDVRFPAEVSSSVIPDASGQPRGIIAIVRDITERKQVDRAKTRFLDVLSHALRTPLTSILGWAKLAQETPQIVPEALHVIKRNAETQNRMLESVLDLSHWLYGRLNLHCAPVELWAIVQEAISAVAQRAEERRITVNVPPSPEPLPIYGDHKRLREVVEQLLENALTFTDPGGQVFVRGEREDSGVRLTVQDTGRGINPDLLPRIFDLFQVGPEVERTGGGLGLGLPWAKTIVEAHGGSITAASPGSGQGTTVTVMIPLEGEQHEKPAACLVR